MAKMKPENAIKRRIKELNAIFGNMDEDKKRWLVLSSMRRPTWNRTWQNWIRTYSK